MPKAAPKRLKQKSLDGFFGRSSSPAPAPPEASSSARSSPKKSPPKSKKRKAPPPRRRGAAAAHSDDPPSDDNGGSTSSDVGGIGFVPKIVEISSDEEDEEIRSPRRPTATQRKTRKLRAESEERTPVVLSSASEVEEVGVPVHWKKKAADAKGKRKRTVLDTDSEEELQPRKSKFVKGARPPTPDEDEDDLLDEVDEKRIIENRFRTRDKKSKYQQNLEKLRRKKRGEAVESSSEEEDEEEEGPAEDSAILPGAKPHQEGQSDDEDADDGEEGLSGFIEEDNNAAIELPPQFSMGTFQDLMHHFKTICQLFVHLAVQPADERREWMEQAVKDQYFAVPLQIARRKIEGMRDSLVTSSVWRTSFKKPLMTYPEFETVHMDFASPGCDACHLGGRMSTITGRVSGEPYDKLTYETLSASDLSSDDEDDEESKVRKEFSLGRFCARRTRVFHQFTHWEYALYKVLAQEVDSLRSRSSKPRVYIPVAYANGTEPPADLDDADGIMNWLDERGVIAIEWQRVKDMMESARNLEIASKRGDDDD